MGFRILTVVLTAFAVYSMVTCLPSNDWHFKGQNVALGKEASQKPATLTENNPHYTSYPARLAVDGNDNNDFSQKSCSHTTSSEKIHHIAQWRVDLEDTYDITGIIIINRKDYRERLKYFIIYGKNYNDCRKWCELYNDHNISAYKNATIRIAINYRQSYHTVAINLPKIDGVPDSGGFSLTLCEVKIFEAPRLVCKVPKSSDKRHMIIYGTTGLLENGFYTNGTILQFSCDEGFLINGPNFVKCLSGGTFNQTLPVCTAACKVITVNNGRMMHPLQTLYTVNSHATIECNEGFLPRSQEITCQYGGHWNHYEQCKQVLCDYPERPNNGYYISPSTSSILEFLSLPFGSIITGRCYEGYEGNDNDTRVCQGNKTWSGIPLTCTKKGCPFPGDLTDGLYLFNNGSLYMSGNSFYNTTIEVKCNKGYVVHGSKILRCSSNKTWSKVSTCQNVTCNLPEMPVNKRLAVCISREGTVEASQAGLIGGITAPLVSLLLVSFVVVFFIRRRRQSRQNKGEKPKRQANLMRRDNDSNRIMIHQRDGDYSEIQEAHSPSSSGNTSSRIGIKKESQSADTMYSLGKDDPTKKPSFSSSVSLQSQNAYYSFTNVDKIPKTAIPMKDLPDLVLTGDVAKNKFEKEFQNLPQGMVEEHKEALSRHNIGKNRYRNLYAYDSTRVVLDTDDNSQSDYINACYVHGFKKPKQYVASQGPTKEILTDFWRMIWQIECSKIVMLTNIVEEGKTKCEQYWPVEGSTTSYGGITVDTENTENLSQFVIRTFKIRNVNLIDLILL